MARKPSKQVKKPAKTTAPVVAPKKRRVSRAEKLAAVREVVERLTAAGQKKLDQQQAEKARKGPGRPSKFSPRLGEEICRRLAEKGSLRRVCAADDMPCFATVYEWDFEGQEDMAAEATKTSAKAEFSRQFARARVIQAHGMIAEARDIADDGSNDWQLTERGFSLNHEHVQRSSLRVNTLFKMAERLAPAIYAPTQKHADADGGKLPPAPAPLNIAVNGTVTTSND